MPESKYPNWLHFEKLNETDAPTQYEIDLLARFAGMSERIEDLEMQLERLQEQISMILDEHDPT